METCGRKISDLTYLDNAKNVPKLPVPTLEETVERLLKSIKPLFSEEEYEECKEKAEHLLDPTKSIGRTLQRRLEERASDPNIVSWAEEWWNDVAYFQNRQSLCFYVNYFFAFRDIKVVDGNSGQQIRPAQTKLAAVLLRSILEYRQEIIDGTFKTDTVREKILCMKQFMYQFGGCRIPGEKVDTTKIYPFEESKHIAVSHKGKFYTLDPYNEDGSIKPIDQLEHMLLALVTRDKSYEPVRGKSIGVLSTLKRGDWYRARKTLLSVSEKNKKSLKMLESSAFLLSLDSNTPETYDELANACYHSDGINGYFDKCFQLLVFKNGRYGFNGEHSLTDGTTDVRLANHIVTFAEDYFTQNEYMVESESSGNLKVQPTELEFDLNDMLKRYIKRAVTYFDHQVFRQEMSVLRFEDFGKERIKKFKVSPDAFVQMALQLAYYRLYDQFVATYESASTRAFAHGRTETSRSVSEASVSWCMKMVSGEDEPKENQEKFILEKATLLRDAIKYQSTYTAAAAQGRGVDRHFMGLRHCVRQGEQLPELFFDETFNASSYWQLSTSQISEERMIGYGWGQVVNDGFGIAYMVQSNNLHFNVCSAHLGSKKMCESIRQSLVDMESLLLEEARILSKGEEESLCNGLGSAKLNDK